MSKRNLSESHPLTLEAINEIVRKLDREQRIDKNLINKIAKDADKNYSLALQIDHIVKYVNAALDADSRIDRNGNVILKDGTKIIPERRPDLASLVNEYEDQIEIEQIKKIFLDDQNVEKIFDKKEKLKLVKAGVKAFLNQRSFFGYDDKELDWELDNLIKAEDLDLATETNPGQDSNLTSTLNKIRPEKNLKEQIDTGLKDQSKNQDEVKSLTLLGKLASSKRLNLDYQGLRKIAAAIHIISNKSDIKNITEGNPPLNVTINGELIFGDSGERKEIERAIISAKDKDEVYRRINAGKLNDVKTGISNIISRDIGFPNETLSDTESLIQFLNNNGKTGISQKFHELSEVKEKLKNLSKECRLTNSGFHDFVKTFKYHHDGKRLEAKEKIRDIITTKGLGIVKNEIENQESSLKHFSYPGDFAEFALPELRYASLEKSGNSYSIKFKSKSDMEDFHQKLSWNVLKEDGSKIKIQNIVQKISKDEGRNVIKFEANKDQKYPINDILNGIEKSEQAQNKKFKNIKKRLDRKTEEILCAAINGVTGGIPVLGFAAHFSGKVFQGLHYATGFGDTPAKILLNFADSTYDHSNWVFPNSNKTLNFIKKDSANSIDQINQRNEHFVNSTSTIDKSLSFIARRPAAYLNGKLGLFINSFSFTSNLIGDALIDTSKKCFEKTKQEGVNPLVKILSVPTAALIFTAGAPFRLLAIPLKAMGNALSESASVYVKSKNVDSTTKTWAKIVDFVNKDVTELRSAPHTHKPTRESNFTISETSDKKFEKVRELAKEMFENIRDPKYTISGISGDDRRYYKVAEMKFDGKNMSLLYSPLDGAVSIVDPSKSQNSTKKANEWPQEINDDATKDNFVNLLKKIDPKNQNRDKRKHYDDKSDREANYAKMTKDGEAGITLKEYRRLLSEVKDDISFKLGTFDTSEYQLKKKGYESKPRLYKKNSKGFVRELTELEGFDKVNELYKSREVQGLSFFEYYLSNPSPSSSPKKPTGKTLKQAVAAKESSQIS